MPDQFLKRADESIKSQEDAAKQLITLSSFLQAVFFAAISFGDVKKMDISGNSWYVVFVLLTVITLTCWIACLFFAVRVFTPRYNAPERMPETMDDAEKELKNVYQEIMKYKQRNLVSAVWLLWLSFIPLTANVLVYLVYLPQINP